ncbi:hypothetical protein [Nonomuraea candida]|uniref:hypothetical protein n=1 Tax=Nonomuraea candida TaxID=359159 RepID=UPI0006943366|nr:hypothetical protein [Nonomuraea candida]
MPGYVYNERRMTVVGQAAASWENEERTTVRPDLVQVLPGIPPEVRNALVRVAVFEAVEAVEAVEAGALRVVTEIDDAALAGPGFLPSLGGSLVLHADTQRRWR